MNEPANATATVTALNCNFHSFVHYSFLVDAKRYDAQGPASNCDKLQAGNKLEVFFAQSDPGLSSLAEPAAMYWNEIAFICFCSVLLPPLLLWKWRKKLRNL
jgi:hypothetical protein